MTQGHRDELERGERGGGRRKEVLSPYEVKRDLAISFPAYTQPGVVQKVQKRGVACANPSSSTVAFQ